MAGYWTGRAGTREGKGPTRVEQWAEVNRRGDGKPGSCGHYFAEVKGDRTVCRRCARDLGSADQP